MFKTKLEYIGEFDKLRNRKGIIYMIVNIINNKKYIGQSTDSFTGRYNAGFTNCHNLHLKRSIGKYGMDNFEVYLVCSGLEDIDLLNQMEYELINEYNTTNPKYGYNKREGGANGRLSEETRIKISEKAKTRIGIKNHFYGKTHTEESRRKMSKAKVGKTFSEETKRKKSEAMIGKTHSEETRLKMSENSGMRGKGYLISGENNGRARKCIIIFDGIEIIKNTREEIVKYMLDEYEIKGVSAWYKRQSVPKKYQDKITYCGYYEDYIKIKNAA